MARAASTAAENSASVSSQGPGSGPGELTPPEAISFTTSAPSRMTVRTPRRISSGPSHCRAMEPPWPAVTEMERPVVSTLGPWTRPWSMASRMPREQPLTLPRSRQATTPADSSRWAFRSPWHTSRAISRWDIGSSSARSELTRWTWQSSSPGVTTPSRGQRRASAGQAVSAWGPTARIRPSSVSMAKSSRHLRPSKSLLPV